MEKVMLPKDIQKNLLGEEMVMESAGAGSSFETGFRDKTETPWEMALLLGVTAFIYTLQFDFKLSALLILSYLVIFFGFGKNVLSNFPVREIFSKTLGKSGKVVANMIFVVFASLLAAKVGIESIIIFMIFLTFIFYRWNKNIGSALGMLFLLSAPILLAFDMKELAGRMATYAYYFFAIAVVFQISEYFLDKRESEEVLVLCPKGEAASSNIEDAKDKKTSLGMVADLAKKLVASINGKATYVLILITVFASLIFYSNIIIASGAAFFLAFLWFYWNIEIPRFLAVASFIVYMLVNTFDSQVGQTVAYVAAYFLAMWLILEFDRGLFRKHEC